jgi:hypothetical protein
VSKSLISRTTSTYINPMKQNLHGPNTTDVTQWSFIHLQDWL